MTQALSCLLAAHNRVPLAHSRMTLQHSRLSGCHSRMRARHIGLLLVHSEVPRSRSGLPFLQNCLTVRHNGMSSTHLRVFAHQKIMVASLEKWASNQNRLIWRSIRLQWNQNGMMKNHKFVVRLFLRLGGGWGLWWADHSGEVPTHFYFS